MWRRKSIDAILQTAGRRALHRTLGPVDLMLLGVGSVIGTGIFVLTADAAQLAGPGMILSFVIAAAVCGATALCYAEIASMVPVSGSAYTYTYAVLGEPFAWLVGWALVLEYAVSASAVAVGWSGYLTGLLQHSFGWTAPHAFTNSPAAGGVIDLPAVVISLLCTVLLVRGTRESARINGVLVAIKLLVLALFVVLAAPAFKAGNFQPFAPKGEAGIVNAASSIFFAYVGFDAVSTASEETKDPQRNVPIGLIGSLVFCTLVYVVVAGAAVGAIGAQPVWGAAGEGVAPGTRALGAACVAAGQGATTPLVCSNEALAYVLRQIGHPAVSGLVGVVAFLALPTVILMMVYGQTRLFFVMARDGLLPPVLTRIHPRWRTPHVVTWITGAIIAVAAAFFPVGALADVSNSGTLFAFFLVAVAVLMLRRSDPDRPRGFRTPGVWVTAPLAMAGCVVLFVFLSPAARLVFPAWSAIGAVLYLTYGIRHSRARADADAEALPPLPDAGA
jgi:APA family basic amino acid/polyamine antiporter